MNWNKVVAVFGGAFDPPHLGHREAIEGLFHRPGVKQVIIMPTGRTRFKTSHASMEQRLEMTCLGLGDLHQIEIDSREIERAKRTQEPTYAYDTLLELRQQIPHLAYVIGTDQLPQLPQWHRFPEILKLCHWIVLERQGTPLQDQQQYPLIHQFGLTLVPTEARAISSTMIREGIQKTNRPPENTLLPSVLRYLKQSRLYGMKEIR